MLDQRIDFWDYIEDKYPDRISFLYSTKKNFDRSLVNIVNKQNKRLNFLDAGCGVGYDLAYFSKYFEIFGLDSSYRMCCKANINLANYGIDKVSIKQGDLKNIPFDNELFDIIVCFSVIDHISINEREKVIRELFRVAKPGAKIIITVPNALSIVGWLTYHEKRTKILRAIPHIWCGTKGDLAIKQEYVEIIDENNFSNRRGAFRYPSEHYFEEKELIDLLTKLGLKVDKVKSGAFINPHVIFDDKELRDKLYIESKLENNSRRGILLVRVSSLDVEDNIRRQITKWQSIHPDLRGIRLGIVTTKVD